MTEGPEPRPERWALDLFSGTGSVRRALVKVLSVDWDRKWNPDVLVDIRRWKYRDFLHPGEFEVIAASPPCTEYSSAMTTRRRRLAQADSIVRATMKLIEYMEPKLWWIENPRFGLLRRRRFMKKKHFVDIDYCCFEDFGYRKATRFWVPEATARALQSVTCDGRCASMVEEVDGRRHHRMQIGGQSPQRGSREQAYRIPAAVVRYLCQGMPTDHDPSSRTQAIPPPRTTLPTSSVQSPATTSSTDMKVRKVMMKPWHHEPRRPFALGRMEHRGGCYELMMNVEVEVDGHKVEAKALIDTGAQTSLVKKDLVPPSLFRSSQRPLILKTVSGEELPGGRQEVVMSLTFAAHTDDPHSQPTTWTTTVTAHDGNISCDLILGYPWLRDNRLDVQPWRHTLQLHDPPRWILTERHEDGRRRAEKKDDIEEDEEDMVALVKKMRLHEPAEDDSEDELSDEEVLDEVAKRMAEAQKLVTEVRGFVMSEDADESELAQALRKEILEEFDSRVFCDRVWPNPPARGTHGKAVLRLKPGYQPVVGRVINLKGERLEALREMEEGCRKDQKIEPGRGPWRAAAFPIKKKSGKWRLVCDYSLTNKMIQPDSYPLPLTEEIVCEQSKSELFSTIDLRDAFHQVALAEESRPVTNIHLPGGLWQWTVVPQGINVGPALLQRDIDATCQPLREFARPYFDDILVSTKREPGESDTDLLRRHAAHVRATLQALEKDRWVSDKNKVRLFMRRVEFVGHVLGGGRRTPAPGKLAAVQRWTLPNNVSSLRAFLGLCN